MSIYRTHQEKQLRWQSYWEHRNDGPIVRMTIPKPGAEIQEPPAYLEAFDGGKKFQQTAEKLARWYESHRFPADSIPYYALSFGSDDFAAYLGADLKLAPDGTTSWPVRPLTSLKDAKIAFDPNGKWWTRTVEFYEILRKTLGDRIMIAAPTLSAGLDGLAGLYGVNNLLDDLIDEPEEVQEALKKINLAFTDVMKEVRRVFEFDKYGSVNRHGMYTTGSIGVPQCDFSCMISGEMFREFALPCIRHEMSELTYGEYHLDGPGAVRHLEDLCTLEKLHTVQWVAGAGEAAEQDWTWLYQKIHDLGRAVLFNGSPETVLRLQRTLRTNAAYYTVWVNNEEEAKRFLEELAQIPTDGGIAE